MQSSAIPAWEVVVLVAAGVLLPLAFGMLPITHASRMTVRAALDDAGGTRLHGASGIDQWLTALRGIDRSLLMALRNAFRRKGRLPLTLALLAAAGAMNYQQLEHQEGLGAAFDRCGQGLR